MRRVLFVLFPITVALSSHTVLKTPKKGIDIQQVMDYPIPQILQRYQKDYGVSEETAKLHERELKRYLIIAAENSPESPNMFSHDVDNLWHTFLLFTKEYERFCTEMFGKFLHHCPKTHENPTTHVLQEPVNPPA